MSFANRTNRIDAAHSRQAQVHQGDIGCMSLKQRHRLLSRAGLGHHRHVRSRIHNGRNAYPHQRMVIHTHDFHLLSIHISIRSHTRGIPSVVAVDLPISLFRGTYSVNSVPWPGRLLRMSFPATRLALSWMPTSP